MKSVGDTQRPKAAAKRSLGETLAGVALIALAIPMVLSGSLFAFPIGVVVSAKLLLADGAGNVGALLGRLFGDLTLFAICAILLYFGVRFLRAPRY